MSEIWFAIFPLILAILLSALFLYLLRQERKRADDLASTLAQAVDLKMTLMAQAEATREDLYETARDQIKQQARENQEFLREALTTTSKAMEQAHLISLNGLQASESSTMKLLASTVTMLGTKDPIAYQQVSGGSFPSADDGTSYAAVDDAVMERLQEQHDLANQQLNLDEAAEMLERLGVKNGSAGFV